MKRIKIGHNSEAEARYKREIEQKINSFKELTEYIKKFNSDIDIIKLYEAPFEYSLNLTTSNYQSAYKGAQIDKVFEMIGFSISKLDQLTSSFENIEHDFDPETLEAIAPDFNYYIDTKEQEERYNSVNNLCKSIETMVKNGALIHYGSLIQSFRGIILPDYKNNSVQPNLAYVLNGMEAIQIR